MSDEEAIMLLSPLRLFRRDQRATRPVAVSSDHLVLVARLTAIRTLLAGLGAAASCFDKSQS